MKKMKVPFTDLSRLTDQVKKAYLKTVQNILDTNQFILSEEVAKFENTFAKMLGVKHCIGVSSGADAIYASLLALGVTDGDEVITQGNAYNASVTAILRTGALPRFADIHENSLTLNPENIEPLINKKTKAILPVHLYGQANDMDAIMKVAMKYKLAVVEDCAQSHLATWGGKMTGTFGDAGAFSFFPTKNLGAFGDAGAVVTNDDTLATRLRELRNLGQASKNNHVQLGYNMRLDPIQAVGLSLKSPYLSENTQERKKAAAMYDSLLTPLSSEVAPVTIHKKAMSVYHLYVVILNTADRAKVQKALTEAGVDTAIHYPSVVYKQPFYAKKGDMCPIAEEKSSQILSLPFFVGITAKQQEYVIQALNNALHE